MMRPVKVQPPTGPRTTPAVLKREGPFSLRGTSFSNPSPIIPTPIERIYVIRPTHATRSKQRWGMNPISKTELPNRNVYACLRFRASQTGPQVRSIFQGASCSPEPISFHREEGFAVTEFGLVDGNSAECRISFKARSTFHNPFPA